MQERPDGPRRVHPVVERLAAYSWRLIVIGIVLLASLWLVQRLSPVLIPVVIALFLTRLLAPVSNWLRARRWRPGFAALATMLAFFVLIAGVGAVIVPSVVDDAGSLGPTLTEALDDVEDWVVEDSPFDVSRESIDRLRANAAQGIVDLFRSYDGAVVDGATLLAEAMAGLFIALLVTFFMLRDGERAMAWAYERAGPRRGERVRRGAERAWWTLGGYLRGAAILGLLEAIVIGFTLFVAGGSLIGPVALITFFAAFVPIVGAITAGVVAVLVGLVTGGLATGIVVAIVALVMQQLDNDLLAPMIYGRALRLHPVVVLLGVVAGGALFGIGGTILAVPVIAVGVNVAGELAASDSLEADRPEVQRPAPA
jgi:predicted PurR-regulated permease PerM